MKNFRCICGNILYFENTQCVTCGHVVGYVPERGVLSALEPAAGETWRALTAEDGRYRLCENYVQRHVCNWLVPAEDPNPYCGSCRLNGAIPELKSSLSHEAWHRLESAKRRLLYSLTALSLPLSGGAEAGADGLRFSFNAGAASAAGLCDAAHAYDSVMTAYEQGIITINLADPTWGGDPSAAGVLKDAPRSLLAHLRHVSGHHYWFRLVRDSRWLGEFRGLFGDERRDYGAALRSYAETGNLRRWRERHISAYASVHPFEDWAETWSHYLLIVDTLETAEDVGITVGGKKLHSLAGRPNMDFDGLRDAWISLSLTLNAVTRSVGVADTHSFVLSDHVIDKLRFIHEVIRAEAGRG